MPFRPSNHRGPWSCGLLALMLIFLMARHNVVDLDRHVRREGLASQVYISARSVLLDLLDIEVGIRGYLLASREEFLRPYHEGLGRFDEDSSRLRVRVGNDSEESPHVRAVSSLAAGLVREFAAQMAVAQSHGIEDARRRFLANPTKPAMDEIRQHLAAIQVEEQDRLDRSRLALDRQLATTVWLLNVATGVTAFVLLSLASGFLGSKATDPPPNQAPFAPAPPDHPR